MVNEWQAEGGEGNVNDGSNNQLVNGHIWGPCQADTGDGQRRSSRRNGCNNNKDKEGGLHSTPWTTATRELAPRLHSAGSRQRRERAMLTTVATKHVGGQVQGPRSADTGDR